MGPILHSFLDDDHPFPVVTNASREEIVLFDKALFELVCSLIDKHDLQCKESIIYFGGEDSLSLTGE
jgi:hypothetical protein